MSKYLGDGCGKALNGSEECPSWYCGDFLEEDYNFEEHRHLGQYYYCEECLDKFKGEK